MNWRITPHLTTKAGKTKVGAAVALDPAGFEKRGGGVGGWESLARPRQQSAAAWVGTPAETLELPALLQGIDRAGPGRDVIVDTECARIESWGRPAADATQPALLQVAGVVGVPTTTRWVLQDVSWGECITNAAGRRVQQEVTLVLLRYLEPKLVQSPARKARIRKPKGKGKAKPKSKGGKK